MTRTFLAIAMALFAFTTYFTPAAKACISCEYVPPVVNTPVYSHTPKYTKRKTYSKQRSHTATKRHSVKKNIAKTPSVTKESSKTAVAKPVKKPDTVETASIGKDEPETENSSIATASSEGDVEIKEATTDEAKVTDTGGCKKFFASVGMTLTVPCQ